MHYLVLSLFCVSAVSGCAKESEEIHFSAHTLNDMGPIVEVVKYLYQNPPDDESVTRKMEFVVYGKILALKAMAPEIELLNGMSIKGLCAVISLSKENEFGSFVADEELTALVESYLEAVEPQVKARADALENTVIAEGDCAI